MIAPASTSPLVTDAGDYIFRTAPSDSLQGRAMAELALKLGFTKAATIHINNQYGVGLADVFTEVFEQGGGSVVLSVPYELERATYRTELSQIKSANPDIIVDVSYADDGQIIFREAAELGISSQLLGSDGIADPAIFDAPGVAEAIDGMVGTRPSAPETSATKHFNSLLSEYGLASGIYSAEAYDAAKMSILAISMAGPDASGSEIRDALVYVSQSYVGASGEKAYDQNGDVGGQFSIWKVIDGEFVTIGSWNIAAGVEIVGN
jgi:branched-chain amino acid transport system substrate-binding protein